MAAEGAGISSILRDLHGKDSVYGQASTVVAGLNIANWSKLSGMAAAAARFDTLLDGPNAITQGAGISSILRDLHGKDSVYGQASTVVAGLDIANWSKLSGMAAAAARFDTLLDGPNAITQGAGINPTLATISLDGWRQSMLAARSATSLAGVNPLWADASVRGLLADLARTSSVTARLASSAAGAMRRSPEPSSAWLGQRPAIRLGKYLQDLRPESSQQDLRVGVSAEHSVSALLTLDVLRHEQDEDEREHVAELFEQNVKPSWMKGAERSRTDLLEALGQLDERLPELLIGAWEDVERGGPAANVKISSCAVEVLERTLRMLAPEADVLVWHAQGRRPVKELSNGRPTYGCRVRYILRAPGHQKHRLIIASQAESAVTQVNELRTIFQGGKHASSVELTTLRGALMSVEAVLHQLTVALR